MLFYLQQLLFSPSYSHIWLVLHPCNGSSYSWLVRFFQEGMKELCMAGKLIADMFLMSSGSLFHSLRTEQDERKSKEG